MPAGSGDRNRQGADRCGLVDHGQDPAVPGQFVEQFPQPGLSIRQRRVMQPFARRIKRDRMMIGLAPAVLSSAKRCPAGADRAF
jgi:hypothetical protein